ncbi:hypothetical protein AVEN_266016-1 [Araneus ventricosus]|uniref:Reverse transcriptase domain-containing protein n=1 Tax=Araneus ventricosus TaxID=182803 RepID=A0A4Y2SEU1_ARAVE|nr:hypothetical protein AVEN_266016-1 [Araneus ventricosus]
MPVESQKLLKNLDDTLDASNGSQWFSTLDLEKGYWQVEIQPEDKEKTAFTTGQGLPICCTPSTCNAPATFGTINGDSIADLIARLVYLDDAIIIEPGRPDSLLIQRLQEYDEIQHQGTLDGNADALSKTPKRVANIARMQRKSSEQNGHSAVKVLTTEDAWSSSYVQKHS